jgi:hypothetical protein
MGICESPDHDYPKRPNSIFIPKDQIPFSSQAVGIWFVSWLLKYIKQQFKGPAETPEMSWLEGCWRRRPGNSEARSWFSVSHDNVGGSTTARGVFGQVGLIGLEIPVDELRQSISHFMKYSICPKPCALPVHTVHYVVGQ